jgi:SsrA-binding protein
LYNMYVAPWANAVRDQTETTRRRKLLLHKHEIIKIEYTIKKQQLNLIPTKVYISKNTIKVELSLARHNKLHDKRRILKKRDDSRQIKNY